MVPEPQKTPANRGRQQPLTTSVMILQLLDRKMVKRSPFPVYFALNPLMVIQMLGLAEAPHPTQGAALRYIGILDGDSGAPLIQRQHLVQMAVAFNVKCIPQPLRGFQTRLGYRVLLHCFYLRKHSLTHPEHGNCSRKNVSCRQTCKQPGQAPPPRTKPCQRKDQNEEPH